MLNPIRNTRSLALASVIGWIALTGPSVLHGDVAAPTPAAAAPAAAAPAAEPAPAAAPAAAPAPQVADPLGYPPGANAGTKLDLQWPVPADSPSMCPTGKGAVTTDEIVNNVAHNKISINLIWTLVTGFLVMFMQAGFAFVETGLVRAKSAAHVMTTNLLIYPLAMLGFWAVGFALMFGGYASGPAAIGWQPTLGQGLQLLNGETSITVLGHSFGVLGNKGFFFGGLGNGYLDTAIFTLFLFQVVFMDTAATIPTGTMAERWNIKNFMIYGLWVGALAYPIYGNWVWGGGWLAQLGQNFGLGHGHVDFAGSSVVHLTGAVIGLVGAWVLGPRIGKFSKDGKPRAIPAHNIPYVVIGTFILAFGWFGFNPGSTLAGTDNHIGIVAVNTMLASAGGAVAACLLVTFLQGKPDPTMIFNGLLAGLVAITAPCAFVNASGAVVIGLISGLLMVGGVYFVERVMKIDDPVGATAVHGVNGAFGVLAIGLFANGSYGAGWNGVHTFVDAAGHIRTLLNDQSSAEMTAKTLTEYAKLTATGSGWTEQGVTGIFGPLFGGGYSDKSQFLAELIGVITNVVFVGGFSLIWFKLSNLIIPIRSKKDDELEGLDISELGVEAYPDYQIVEHSISRE